MIDCIRYTCDSLEQPLDAPLLDQGLTLMLVGMGTVFSFLAILVAAISMMSAIAKRVTPISADDSASDEEVAVITVAIDQHRKQTEK